VKEAVTKFNLPVCLDDVKRQRYDSSGLRWRVQRAKHDITNNKHAISCTTIYCNVKVLILH